MVFFMILQLYFEKWFPEILIQILLGNFATFVFGIRTNLWTKRSKLVLAENQVATTYNFYQIQVTGVVASISI